MVYSRYTIDSRLVYRLATGRAVTRWELRQSTPKSALSKVSYYAASTAKLQAAYASNILPLLARRGGLRLQPPPLFSRSHVVRLVLRCRRWPLPAVERVSPLSFSPSCPYRVSIFRFFFVSFSFFHQNFPPVLAETVHPRDGPVAVTILCSIVSTHHTQRRVCRSNATIRLVVHVCFLQPRLFSRERRNSR